MNDANTPVVPGGKHWIPLGARSIITVTGGDARDFLQGLISSDAYRISPTQAIYGALLTPQGKFLHEFFLVERDGLLLLDCEIARKDDLLRRLTMYKLRADVDLVDAAETYRVFALLGDHGFGYKIGEAQELDGGVAFVDPRLAGLGARAILPETEAENVLTAAGYTEADFNAYDRHRLSLGVPDGSRDLTVDKSVLMESNFDELHGVDFEKGCYVGQEVTTRTKRRGLVKKRLLPVDVSGPLPAPGTPVLLGDRDAGVMCSGLDGRGLALLKLEKVEQSQHSSTALRSSEAELKVVIPNWLTLAGSDQNSDTGSS